MQSQNSIDKSKKSEQACNLFIVQFWKEMIERKYKNTWISEYGKNPMVNNVLTNHAQNWIDCFKGLSKNQIKSAYDLLYVDFPTFPPSPMEFKNICVNREWDEVLEDITLKLQDISGHKWTNQLAFNAWHCFAYNPSLNQSRATIVKECKRIYQLLDKSALFSLPNYETKAIEQKTEVEKGDKWRIALRRAVVSYYPEFQTNLNKMAELTSNRASELITGFKQAKLFTREFDKDNKTRWYDDCSACFLDYLIKNGYIY